MSDFFFLYLCMNAAREMIKLALPYFYRFHRYHIALLFKPAVKLSNVVEQLRWVSSSGKLELYI